jgi:hypothetical protein
MAPKISNFTMFLRMNEELIWHLCCGIAYGAEFVRNLSWRIYPIGIFKNLVKIKNGELLHVPLRIEMHRNAGNLFVVFQNAIK